jgi:mono/diheme cytochrome c family protein
MFEALLGLALALAPAPLLQRFECGRCHDGVGAVAPAKRCVGCHRDVIEGRFRAEPETLARWQGALVSLRAAPSLAGAGGRLRRDWVKAFLLAPEDVRPGLPASMPRLPLADADAEAIAAALVPREAPAATFTPDEAKRGEALYGSLGCGGCHRFRGTRVDRAVANASDAAALAPDLAVTRRRFQSGALVRFLLAPPSTMPRFPLDAAEARALAAFILLAPVEAPRAASVPARLPILARRVGWDEVSERVFRRVCWHCHAQPDYARGDGGPGMTGGFGFVPRGLDLSSYTGAMSGSLDDDGRRRSVFTPLADGTPRLLAHLLARQAEEAGRPIPGLRGMPLGLPALSPEDIQLVASWIAQGRPR